MMMVMMINAICCQLLSVELQEDAFATSIKIVQLHCGPPNDNFGWVTAKQNIVLVWLHHACVSDSDAAHLTGRVGHGPPCNPMVDTGDSLTDIRVAFDVDRLGRLLKTKVLRRSSVSGLSLYAVKRSTIAARIRLTFRRIGPVSK